MQSYYLKCFDFSFEFAYSLQILNPTLLPSCPWFVSTRNKFSKARIPKEVCHVVILVCVHTFCAYL